MVAEVGSESYEFLRLGDTYRVLPGSLHELKNFAFWSIPEAEKEKQPGHWNGSKWSFNEWQKDKNLEWMGDAVRLSRDLKVNVGLVVPEYWVVIDFDQCREPISGDIHPKVKSIIERLRTVVLVSSSGTGLHAFLKYTTDQPLPDESKFSNPDLSLDIFEVKKKGELKKPGTFVAISWHPLLGYSALDQTVQQFPEWLESELFTHKEAVPLTRSPKPIPLTTSVSEPRACTTPESEPEEPPFGIKWKSNFRQTAINKLAGWNDRPDDSDETISGEVFSWLMFYWMAVEDPDWDEAFDLSVRAEGFYLNKRLPGSKRNRKSPKWHEYNVNKSLKFRTNKSSDERMVFKAKGEKYGKTPQEQRILNAVKYARAEKMRPTDYVFFLDVLSESSGRSDFRLTDGVIVERTGLSESSVTRAKNSFRCKYEAVLEIERNKYRIIE